MKPATEVVANPCEDPVLPIWLLGVAAVIPYPAKVVGLVPAVTRPFVSTVTDLYVSAATPELANVKAIDVVPDPETSPDIVML